MQVCAFETHQHLRLSIRVVLLRQRSLWGIFTKSNLYSLWLFLTIFDYRTQKVKEVGKKEQTGEMFHEKIEKRFSCNINCNFTFPVLPHCERKDFRKVKLGHFIHPLIRPVILPKHINVLPDCH